MKRAFSAITVAMSIAFCSVQSTLALPVDPNVRTSVQRASCGGGGVDVDFVYVPSDHGFGPSDMVVSSETKSTNMLQQAGYVVVPTPKPPVSPATRFKSVTIDFKTEYGDPVLNGKVRFTLEKSNGGLAVFTKKWSDLRPTGPVDGWRTLTAVSADFPQFEDATLTRLLVFIDNASLVGSGVLIGDYKVSYGTDGKYLSTTPKFPVLGCEAFQPLP